MGEDTGRPSPLVCMCAQCRISKAHHCQQESCAPRQFPATPVTAGPAKPVAVDWQVVSVFVTKPSVLNLNMKATHTCVD